MLVQQESPTCAVGTICFSKYTLDNTTYHGTKQGKRHSQAYTLLRSHLDRGKSRERRMYPETITSLCIRYQFLAETPHLKQRHQCYTRTALLCLELSPTLISTPKDEEASKHDGAHSREHCPPRGAAAREVSCDFDLPGEGTDPSAASSSTASIPESAWHASLDDLQAKLTCSGIVYKALTVLYEPARGQ